MKKLKTFLTVILLSAMLITALVSCNDKTPSEEDKNPEFDISAYQIIRIDASNQTLTDMTVKFKKSIKEHVKSDLKVGTDYVKRGEELDENTDKNAKEILIGDTNRSASIAAVAELNEKGYEKGFIIKVTDNKIAIVGTSDNDTVLGLKYFITNYVLKSEKDNMLPIKSGDTFSKENGDIIHIGADLEMVVLEKLSTIYNPGKKSQVWTPYCKVIKLECQPDNKNNGILLATHEQRGGSHSSDTLNRYPVFSSSDDGDTWKRIAWVNDNHNKGAIVGWQPSLYELPADVGEYKAGTVLMGTCTRIQGTATMMVTHASKDCGKTWKTLGNVAVGGPWRDVQNESDGLYEPVYLYEEETKRLYCFYSDEIENGADGHSQRLVYKYTTDLVNWSDIYEMVACDEFDLRPGMVAITRMGDGRYAMAYELGHYGAHGHYPIFIKYTDRLDDWGDPNDVGVPVSHGEKIPGSAPAIAWTPDGGEKGTLFLMSSGKTGKYDTNTWSDLFISFDYGETWTSIENPIPTMGNDNINGVSYSSGMYVDKNGTLYHANNTQVAEKTMSSMALMVIIKVY